jgi:hypothetical protein
MISLLGRKGNSVFPVLIGRLIGSMVIIFLIPYLSIVFFSCSSPSPEEVARADAMVAAQHGYDLLLEGDYEGFSYCHAGMERCPASYRQQMVDAYKMYIDRERRAHKGISHAKATRAEMDSTLNLMQVFMLLTFADSTQEEIVVPVVQHEGQWKLR